MKSCYPVLFGCMALDSKLPDERLVNESELIYNASDMIVIHQLGKSKEIHLYRDGANLYILFGRVYNPFKINQFQKDSQEKLYSLSNISLGKIEGSFVYFKIIKSENGIDFYVSTDKYGFRRLLYFQDGQRLYFATHLDGIRILLQNRLPGISKDSLLHYYNFGFTSNDQTILTGIRKLPPGSTMSVEKNTVSIAPYFSIADFYRPMDYASSSEGEICKAIDLSLLESVQRRIPGEGPVGVALSGGVDSGYIAQKLVQSGSQVLGYNIAYRGYYDEFNRIDFLAKALGIQVRKILVTPGQVTQNFEYANTISSEPMGFNNATMRFVAMEAQKDGIQALFDGDGSDRIFLGMSRYLQYQKVLGIYNLFKRLGLIPLINSILPHVPYDEFKKLSIHFKNWNNGICPYQERNMDGVRKYDAAYEHNVYDLAVKRFRERFEQEFGSGDFGLFFTYQAIHMCPEMFFYDPAEIQTELGLFPVQGFWDDGMVSVAISLPTGWKLRQGKTKYILRKAATRNLQGKYWMLPKIGLQNSFSYVVQSNEGRQWQSTQHDKVRDSKEFKILRQILPGGNVQLDKLIGLIVWKEKMGID